MKLPVLSTAITIAALALAGPALAQSTLILPEGGGYLIIPPSGRSTQVVPQPGGGTTVVGPQAPSTVVPTIPGSPAAAAVPFSAAEPCCPGLPGPRQ